jgi:hypothetical protein
MVSVLNWIALAAAVVGILAVIVFFVGPRE